METVYWLLAFGVAIAGVAELAVVWRVTRRLAVAQVEQRVDIARLRHDWTADYALHVRKLSDPHAVAAYVRTHVDQRAAELLAQELGPEGYERYLVDLHARYTR